MAGKNEARFTFTADTKDFNASIKQADSQMKQLRSELKLNEAQMKNSGQTVDGLSRQHELLEQQSQALSQKVDALNGKYDAACRIWGENSAEAQRFATQINGVLTAQERVNGQLESVNQAIRQQSAAQSEAQSAYGQLSAKIDQQRSDVAALERAYANAVLEFGKTSSEAKDLESKLSQANTELQESERRMSEAEDAAKDLARGLDDASDSAKDMDSSIGDIAAGNVIADFASNAIGSLTGLVDATADYRNEQNKLKAISSQTGQDLGVLQGRYQDLFAITNDSTLSSTAVANMSAMGLSVDQTNSLVQSATGIWAQYGDSIPLDGLMEAVNETANVGTVTGTLADALNWAGISEDDFNEKLATCSSTQERQQLIIDTLNAKYGALGDAYTETNASVIEANRANDNLMQAQSKLAEAIAPIQAAVTNLAANGISFLADNLNWIVPIVGSAAAGFAAFKGAMAIQSAVTAFSGSLGMIPKVLTTMMGPVGIVVAAISALVAGFMLAYNNCEPFRTAINNLVTTLGETFGPVLQQIATLVSGALSTAFQYLGEFLTTSVVPLLTQFAEFIVTTVIPAIHQIATWVSENVVPALQNMWQWFSENILPILAQFADFLVTSVIPFLGELAGFILSTVVSALQTFWKWFSENILPILQEFWDFAQKNIVPILQSLGEFIMGTVVPALQNMWKWFSENIIPILKSVWDFISANILPIFASLAEFITGTVVSALRGLWDFFSNNILPILETVWGAIQTGINTFNSFKDTVGNVIEGAKRTVDDGLRSIGNFFSGLKLEFPKIKLPHFSISGEFSLSPLRVPSIGVSWYAEGGIMNKPTAFGFDGSTIHVGGEAGPEAITPLDRLQDFIDSALDRFIGSSLDDVVDAIESLGDRVTVLEIDGNEIARATAEPNDRVQGYRQSFTRRGLAL